MCTGYPTIGSVYVLSAAFIQHHKKSLDTFSTADVAIHVVAALFVCFIDVEASDFTRLALRSEIWGLTAASSSSFIENSRCQSVCLSLTVDPYETFPDRRPSGAEPFELPGAAEVVEPVP